MNLAQKVCYKTRYTSHLALPKCLWQHVDDLGRQAKVARVDRLYTCGYTGWAEAMHEGGAGVWAGGGRARAPLALPSESDGQLRYLYLMCALAL